ncbi:hypothetical protein SUGI_0667330 [Cryptomeria japonica]|nr:hypothetical protein SUGI_0667330 [Cryptomeria japonica]
MKRSLPWLYLLTPGSLYLVTSSFPLLLGSMKTIVVLHVLHLRVIVAIPIKVVLSSMEGEMDVVGGDLPLIEVELDVSRFSYKCWWGNEEVKLLGYV